MQAEFEWDQRKALLNILKHGVAFEEALTVFHDPGALVMPDPRHSQYEERLVILGCSGRGRLLAVMFVERHHRIRLISARPATRRERSDYEETPR